MKTTIEVSETITRTPRVMQIETLFDVPPSQRSTQVWEADLPIETKPWSVGLIVGPSGAGKSTILREMFGDKLPEPHLWSPDKAIVDEFPADMPVKDITALLSSVGLGSIPTWMRPWRTLSTGEQFRAQVAVTLATEPELAIIDEWTSVVDRQVAKVASAATAKTVRKLGHRFIAATCHYDVEEWLNPDWVYQPHLGRFTWRSLHPRPTIDLKLSRVDRASWRVFRRHHYLTSHLPAGDSWGAFTDDGDCIAFCHFGPVMHPSPKAKNIRRMHRCVVLPDWQGLGIGPRMVDALSLDYARRGFRVRAVAAHPGMVSYWMRSPRWHMVDGGKDPDRLTSGPRAQAAMRRKQRDVRRLTTYGFEYLMSRADAASS